MARYINSVPQILDSNNKIIANAKKFFFEVGTTTKKTIYSDSALTIAAANPALSDSAGRFGEIFLSGLYKEEQQDNTGTLTGYDGVTIWTRDPVGESTSIGPLALWDSAATYDIPQIVFGSDNDYYRTLADSNIGNNPTTTPASWEKIKFGRVWNANISYVLGNTAYGSDGFLYISNVAPNLASDPLTSDKWDSATRQGQFAIAAGTVDAITAVFSPVYTALKDGMEVRVRALGANATTTPTFSPDGLTAHTIVKNGNQALIAGDIPRVNCELIFKYNLANTAWELLNQNEITYGNLPTGTVLQRVQETILTVTSSAAVFPYDDSIPQQSEGTQIFSLVITPKRATSTLYFDFVGQISVTNATDQLVVALFKDTDQPALAVSASGNGGALELRPMPLIHNQVSGAIVAQTYKIKFGTNVGTAYLNGDSARKYGGVLSSVFTITEVAG